MTTVPLYKKTILVVEDNPLNMKLTVDLLELSGFVVLKAQDGITALDILKTTRPELILLDIQLPDIDGVEVFRRIREDKRLDSVKVIAVTAAVMKERREEIIKAGFDGLILKPIDTKGFIKEVKGLVSKDK